ncbi:hypothetical protein DEO72_LG7g1284 [Vigna unguiculata]|uniref:Uncharacterized protein n=1 Tax=Vigna unguiculata TaxID=3917 RepID=A0A4D6MG60_VIGUN|nr:hypothetical protein DEO72_LG7g1284 [Vigna unguiculata]
MAAGAKMVAAGVVQWCAVPRDGRKEVRRRLWRLERGAVATVEVGRRGGKLGLGFHV